MLYVIWNIFVFILWVVISTLLIAVAYGFFVSFFKRTVMGIIAAVAYIIHILRFWIDFPEFINNHLLIIAIAAMIAITISDAEGIVKPPYLELKTAFVRAGLMALSTLGTNNRVYHTIFKHGKYDKDGARISKCKLPDGYSHKCLIIEGSNVEIVRPKNEIHRVVFIFPGGGFAGRMTDRKMNYAWYYSEAAGGAVSVILDYKTSLDGATFPKPLMEAYKIYNWILSHGYKSSDIIFGGDSAGGNLALTLTEYLRDNSLPLPAGVITFSAWTDMSGTSESYRNMRRFDALFGNNRIIEISARQYVSKSKKSLTDKYVSPYFIKDFKNFPPILMQVGSYEMLLSSSMDFAQRAIKSGVDANVEVYEGMFHEFQRTREYNSYAQAAWLSVKSFIIHLYKDNY